MKSSTRCAILLLVLIAILMSLSLVNPAQVSAQTVPQVEPTAAPQVAQNTGGLRLPLWVGILILLAPLGFMVWKSRDAKQPDVKSSSCLPVLKDGERPFQIHDDDPA